MTRNFWLLIALAVLSTYVAGALMSRLATRAEGLLPDRYALLMSTHWWRVSIVTVFGVTVLRILVQTTSGPGGSSRQSG